MPVSGDPGNRDGVPHRGAGTTADVERPISRPEIGEVDETSVRVVVLDGHRHGGERAQHS